MRSAAQSPFTFNVAYADDRDVAMFSAGRLPIRPRGVDPGLPADGRGGYEWRGFLPARRHPQQVDPPSGELINWNNKPAHDFPAADDLDQRLDLPLRHAAGRHRPSAAGTRSPRSCRR